MTVLDNPTTVTEQGNGSKTAFDFSFKVFNQSDIKVYKVTRSTGALSLQTITSDYTVSLTNNGDSGGTVTYVVAPTASEDSLIVRELDFTQEFDVPVASNFPEVQLENAYDKNTMLAQQLREQVQRALLLPITTTLSNLEFPEPTANKALVWNSGGTALVNSTDDFGTQASDAQASADAAAASAASASSSASAASTSETNAAASAASIDGGASLVEVTGNLTLNNTDHRGRVLYTNTASNITITASSTLPVGFQCSIIRFGTGDVDVATQNGDDLNGVNEGTGAINQQYTSAYLVQISEGEFIINGNVGVS